MSNKQSPYFEQISTNTWRRLDRTDQSRNRRGRTEPQMGRFPVKGSGHYQTNIPYREVYVEHRVTDRYKRLLQKEIKRKRKEKSAESAEGLPIAPHQPYGAYQGQAIQGPANWNQLWNYSSMGKDIYQELKTKESAQKRIMEYLKPGVGTNEQLQNIKFNKLLYNGPFSEVYHVTAIMNNKELALACKIMKLNEHIPANVPMGIIDDTEMPPCQRRKLLRFQKGIEELLKDIIVIRYLKHNNIIKMKDMITIADRKTGFPFSKIMMFFELCDGDLQELLNITPPDYLLAEHLCRYWFKQIANALKYLHDNRVVHLDIKPANIFYVYKDESKRKSMSRNPLDMNFKLGDFGLSITYTEDEPMVMNDIRGTRGYVAQELQTIPGRTVQTKPCDIYSLGASLARTLISRGKFTLHGQEIHLWMFQQRNITGTRWNVSQEVAKMIAQMTNERPDWRPTIGQVLTNYIWVHSDITNPRPVRKALMVHSKIRRILQSIGRFIAISILIFVVVIMVLISTHFFTRYSHYSHRWREH